MGKTTRDQVKRKIAQAFINIDYAGQYLHEIETLFKDDHPELAEGLHNAQAGLFTVQETLKVFCEVAYGVTEPDWSAWAATGRPRHELDTES